MRMCILTPDANIEAARANANENIGVPAPLSIPVSPTGEAPPTHWFCNFKISSEMKDKLIAINKYSEMVLEDDSKKFLEERGLKLVRRI